MAQTDLTIYKFTGAGNDFVILDDRQNERPDGWYGDITPLLCNRYFGIGGDGLMVLRASDSADFRMLYFNSDGSLAGMCGNGGRCLAEFFFLLTGKTKAEFEARSGNYFAERVTAGKVSLTMVQPSDIEVAENGEWPLLYLNTGTQHLVKRVENVDSTNVLEEGSKLRYSDFALQKGGSNVNFIEVTGPTSLKLRTYEKGVEGETMACGTGTVAAALAAINQGWVQGDAISVQVRGGDTLYVKPAERPILTGPATYLFSSVIRVTQAMDNTLTLNTPF